MNEAKYGYLIQVGDIIKSIGPMASNEWKVHRVTPKFAYVKYNDIAEGKFPRVYGFAFQSLPKQQWRTTSYKVFTGVSK